MSKKEMEVELRRQIENYENTIRASIVLGHDCCWDAENRRLLSGARFSLGRKMYYEGAQPGDKCEYCTPDLISQVNRLFGVLAEVKISYSFSPESYDDLIKDQIIRKYDRRYYNWFFDIDDNFEHDLVVIIDESNVTDFLEYLRTLLGAGSINFERPFSVISFLLAERVESSIRLRLEFGSLSNSVVNKRLSRPLFFPLGLYVKNYGHVQFNDAPPPIPYLIRIIWEYIISPRAASIKYDKKKGCKPVEVRLSDITVDLKKYTLNPDDEHVPEMPRQRQVREALDNLVAFDFAEKLPGSDETYLIKYKRYKRNLQTVFVQEYIKLKRKEASLHTKQKKLLT